jgi:hypothetical protein
MESLDSILANLQQKYQEPNPSDRPAPVNVKAVSPDIAKDVADLDLDYLNLPTPKPNSIDRLLADLRQPAASVNSAPAQEDIQVSASAPQDFAQKISKTAITADLQQVSAQQSAKEQQARSEAAQKWLQALDPLSGEGLWFAEFAKNYDSHLEAAIALLSP